MTEPRYTLAEARAELARQECIHNGHDYDVLDNRTMGNSPGHPIEVYCTTCHSTWPIARPQRDTEVTVDIGPSTALDRDIVSYLRKMIRIGDPVVTHALRKETR